MGQLNSLARYCAQIHGANEYEGMDRLKSRINDAIEDLASRYHKDDTPDLIVAAIGHLEMATGCLWRHMKRLDDGENA